MINDNGDTNLHDLATKNLSAILARAEGGDVLAAKEVLDTIAFLLSPANVSPSTGEPLPVPLFVREYLSRAFYRIAAAVDPAKAAAGALHLAKRGPRTWRYEDKLLGATMVATFVQVGSLPVDEAAAQVADEIKRLQAERRADPTRPPVPMRGQSVAAETLRTWYFQLKDEVARRQL